MVLRLVRPGVIVLMALLVVSWWCELARAQANVEQITGVVVAYDEVKPSLTCIEICETSLIVRLDKPGERESSYIRVDLKFADRRKFPRELISSSKTRWQLMVVRTADRDEKLEEFILGEDVYGKALKNPIWRRVPGAEDERLPFGEVLRSYSLLKDGFKIEMNKRMKRGQTPLMFAVIPNWCDCY